VKAEGLGRRIEQDRVEDKKSRRKSWGEDRRYKGRDR
jgi:hypothetical protein